MTTRHELQPAIIAWAFGVPEPTTIEGAEQYLRTQVHPLLYDAVGFAREALRKRGAPGIRRVAEQMDYNALSNFYSSSNDVWVQEAVHVIDKYTSGSHDADPYAFADLATLASFFDEEVLNALSASVLAMIAQEQWNARWKALEQEETLPFIDFRNEWQEIAGLAQQQRVDSIQPRTVMDMDPQYTLVDEGKQQVYYHVPRQLRLFDPIRRHHDILVGEPQEVKHHEVDALVNIPWEAAENGITLRITMKGEKGYTATDDLFIRPEQLETVRARGTAIMSTVGRFGDIQLHAEHFSVHPFGARSSVHKTLLPNEPVASLRVRQNSIEVKKLQPRAELTVFA